ncbi:PAS domain-containing sensor histidine kinase [Microvirga lenta]|uniref:PAS domain-containing sensor histidine kinase n=1 Tax=Microvirga lenta TaxID=2881337 RepID=UPI001CFF73F2|nr:PAS domain S-box protein [Microvirga lenta]MCB5176960.1 PAS domain S-box protein [Microvirga lenta]
MKYNPTESLIPAPPAQWPGGRGEMAGRVRGHDWASTPLGAVETWPQSLKTAVDLMLASRQPVYIAWGPELTSLYNDGYIPILGTKHPDGLGKPYADLFAEIWEEYRPVLAATMAGEAQHFVDKPVGLAGRTGLSTSWFTFSWTPLRDEAGAIAGFYCAATETTEKVRNEEALRESKEAALRQSEARYRTLFDSMDEGFCVLQLILDDDERPVDYRYVETNPAFERQTGMKDALGKTIRELVPDIEPYWFDIYGKVALTGEATRFVNHAPSMGRWFDVNAFRIGEPHRRQVAVLFKDIADRKRAEDALRRSEERQRSALSISTVGVMFWDDKFGLTEVNDAFLSMTGFSREEALGKTWQELTPEEFFPPSLRAVEEVTTRGENTPYEKQYFRKDGSRWWGLFAARKVGDEIVEFVLDITARKEAEAALRESEARFRHMADSAPALIWMSDDQGRIVFANMHYDYLFGRPASEMTGSGWRDIVHPDDLEEFEQTFLEAFQERRPIQTEVRVLDRHGAVRWLRCEGVPRLDDAHRFLGYTGCNVDITAAKVAEERRDLLINELNHRVKNTLATVQSITSQTLRTSETAAEAREAIEGRLIALSRAHDVLTRENWEGADLYEIVEQAVAPYSSQGEDRLHLKGPEVRLPPRTALSLAMMLQELATNAVKYGALSSSAGEIRIAWEVDPAEPPQLQLRWEESGGPPVQAPTRRGFGTRLIERSLAQDLGGDVRIVFAPTGVVCTVAAPLAPA